jgi:hypothetical protein
MSDQRHAPRRQSLRAEIFDVVLHHIDDDVGAMQHVVREILLDHVALVAKADDEMVQPVMRIEHHDVPQDRVRPDFDHGLRPRLGLLGETRTQATGENDDFHDVSNRKRGLRQDHYGARTRPCNRKIDVKYTRRGNNIASVLAAL